MKRINLSGSQQIIKNGAVVAGILFFLIAAHGARSSAKYLSASRRNSQSAPAPMTVESRTVGVRINRPFSVVYDFLAAPENWNSWAAGLGKSIRRSSDGWVADSSDGQLKVRFTPRNSLGVVDHYVRRPSGVEVYVPMRVITNGTGSELLFTLFREPGMSDERFAADLEFVRKDLSLLKSVLEK